MENITGKTAFVIILLAIILPLINGCDNPPVPERQIWCRYISNAEEFRECTSRANSGDANAAFGVAKVCDKDERFYTGYKPVKTDRKTAFHYYKVAADLGHEEALRIIFDSYYFGKYGPENKAEAERYLIKASNLGHEWAMLLLAHWSEDSDPEKALDLYLQLARLDNCHAQKRLSELYFEGKIVPQDLCKSYFWALLANVGRYKRSSDCHELAFEDFSFSCGCGYTSDTEIKKKLNSKYIQLVQTSASQWQEGQIEPDLPIVQTEQEEKPSLAKIIPPELIKVSKKQSKEKPIEWIPVDIELNTQLKVNLTSSEIFALANPSVWVVFSAATTENLKAMNNASQGSAVAISKNMLLTNYHVVDKRPYVLIKHGEQFAEAAIYAGDKQSDRCILIVESIELKPVKGFTKYDQLSIGDNVYSIGSPQGLENSLGQGIVSGKREVDEQNIIQTTAHISPGSSGGGLFDCSGNLIGITTFKVIGSEGLNFAIPIEDFTK